MRPLVVLTILATVLAASYASSIRMDKVVRALDALYKRQSSPAPSSSPSPSSSPPPSTSPDYGSGSGEYGSGSYGSYEESCQDQNYQIMWQIHQMMDNQFLDRIRGRFFPLTETCRDLFYWLRSHDYEEHEAEEGSTPTVGPVRRKKSSKLDNIKRSLRELQTKLERRQYGGGYDEEELDERDLEWHRIYVTCYMWTHVLQPGDNDSGSSENWSTQTNYGSSQV